MNDYMTKRPRKWDDIKEIPNGEITDALKLVLHRLPRVEATAFYEPQDETKRENMGLIVLFSVERAACVLTDEEGRVYLAFKFPITVLNPVLDVDDKVHVEGWGNCSRARAAKEAVARKEDIEAKEGALRAAKELQEAFERAANGPACEDNNPHCPASGAVVGYDGVRVDGFINDGKDNPASGGARAAFELQDAFISVTDVTKAFETMWEVLRNNNPRKTP